MLLVEDEADVVDLLRYNLNKAGFSVLVADDGLTGLEIARENRPDIIVLDLMLPGMDGYSVCKALKKDPETEAAADSHADRKGRTERTGSRLGDRRRRLCHKAVQSARACLADPGAAAEIAVQSARAEVLEVGDFPFGQESNSMSGWRGGVSI